MKTETKKYTVSEIIQDRKHLYISAMYEVKSRYNVCGKIVDTIATAESLTGMIEADIDLLYLQIRKIIELIMFASLEAHLETKPTLSRRLRKEYHAGKLIQEIGRINPGWFPCRVRELIQNDKIAFVECTSQEKLTHLTETEFKEMYVKICGIYAHAQRRDVYGTEAEIKEKAESCKQFMVKLMERLIYHSVNLPDKTQLICGTDGTSTHNQGVVYVCLAIPA